MHRQNHLDSTCITVVRVPGYISRGPGSIPWATRGATWKKKVVAPVQKVENTAVGIRHANHVAASIRKSWYYLRRQAAVSRSVWFAHGTQATEFSFFFPKDPIELMPPFPHLKIETGPVSDTLCFPVRIPDDEENPQTKRFWMLCTIVRTLYLLLRKPVVCKGRRSDVRRSFMSAGRHLSCIIVISQGGAW
jgi:hypothetical protein